MLRAHLTRASSALPFECFVLVTSLISRVIGSQPSAPAPIPGPLRELPWGQLNFLHTTDIHGWLGGHLKEYVAFLEKPVSSLFLMYFTGHSTPLIGEITFLSLSTCETKRTPTVPI